MFLYYPLPFLIQCNEMEIICSMLKMMMLVSKERKSTRFYHSFFDLRSDITKQRRAWTEVETVTEAKLSRSHVDDALKIEEKLKRNLGTGPEEKHLTSVPTEFIAIFLNVDIRLESI